MFICVRAQRPLQLVDRLALLLLHLPAACINLCAILLGYYAGEFTGDVVDGFDETIESFDEAGHFVCGGQLQEEFFAGEGLSPGEGRLETIRRRIEVEKGPAYLCQTGSVVLVFPFAFPRSLFTTF